MYFVQWFPYSRVYSWVKVLAHILSVRWTTCQVSVRLFYSFLEFTFTFKTLHFRTFLVVQWFRLRLPMQGVQVWSLVGELGSYMPPGQKTKTWNKSNIVTNSIKDLKIVHIKWTTKPHYIALSESGEQLSVLKASVFLACAVPASGVHTARGRSVWHTQRSGFLSYLRRGFQVPGWSFLGHSYIFCSFPLPGSMYLRMIFLGNSWLIVFLLSYFFPVTGNADFFFFSSIWADGILLPKIKWVWGNSQKWNVNHFLLLKYLE